MHPNSSALRVFLVIAAVGCEPGAPPGTARETLPPESLAGRARSVDTAGVKLSGTGVGCARVGNAVESVRATCDVITDTTVQGLEGSPERMILVRAGAGVLPLTIVNDSVFRVTITDPAIRTADYLGVGTELDDLLALPGAAAIEGEGRLFVTLPSHCGLSFRLDAVRDGRSGTTDELVRTVLPRNTTVDRVLAVGC